MRQTEEKVNFILRDVHKNELARISGMQDRYEEQLAPLEFEAQTLQDSLDLLAIQALTGDTTLDSLYLRRKEVENKNVTFLLTSTIKNIHFPKKTKLSLSTKIIFQQKLPTDA